ncbi:MAG TPA: cytochrome P450 [Pseudonocardiaceae bacterium]|nr:cytochrome P450 [Pseudonocardiaceae bacterium]
MLDTRDSRCRGTVSGCAPPDEVRREGLTDEQIRNEAMGLLMAGYESTAAGMAWAWYLLSQNPDVERQLQAELRTVLDGRIPTVDDLPKLRYTRMVIDEALRLYPPFPAFFRTSIDADMLGGRPGQPCITVARCY